LNPSRPLSEFERAAAEASRAPTRWYCQQVLMRVSLLLWLGATQITSAQPIKQEAYVWQRDWSPAVKQAIREHSGEFSRLVYLSAEVTWKQKQPQMIRVPMDYGLQAESKGQIGLALRIGPYRGQFATNDIVARYLANLSDSIVQEAKATHLAVSELQLDFDCAESKLSGYALWVEAIRAKIRPVPLCITALPAWLKQPSFKTLVDAGDGYVLQVHSLARPQNANASFSLCDPQAARRAVDEAAKLGVPFRVALPTYGYLIAFDRTGKFIGLSAEGPAKNWPADAQVKETRSNPTELAELVRLWSTNYPPNFLGIIWYRLPTRDDVLNFRWPTLAAVMAGRLPKEGFRAEARQVESGLVEIALVNDGQLDVVSRCEIETRWPSDNGTRLVAADALQDFQMMDSGTATVKFQSRTPKWRLPAGERRVIGWVRLTADREVEVKVSRF
jgi:Protein of unknown function (DUF3142)